ncbi:MAG TPA: carbamoyltransferase HypF [Opitutaceae bacterium]|jgi:hydrogenase maturation protein HypF|nr:carbamoyltransferase HypF [Opitutaceae bacterium]
MPHAPVSPTDVLLRVRGTVQGVGFRPFVQRRAQGLGLRGWVRNDTEGVLIRAAGAAAAVAELRQALAAAAPGAARVESVETLGPGAGDPPPGPRFAIAATPVAAAPATAAVAPDLALCPDCRRELFDPADRRHRYPFINCTQCGPRYSILETVPYDRPRTTMRAFRMCPSCQREYDDPGDRRFHAQPNACPACGPALWLSRPGGPAGPAARGASALDEACAVLDRGGILAVKGIGGYHLLADAGSAAAVGALRARKHRGDKPFAVMFPDLESVAAAAELDAAARAELDGPAAPIVLLRRRPAAPLAAEIAPGNPWVGALLPYSPLHALLLARFRRPVVATSGNLAEEPLCTEPAEAELRLGGMADAFLHHDRPIAHPVDDSVIRLTPVGKVCLRRARGLAPAPLRLPVRLDGCCLCVGAELKNAVALASGDRVVLSPHIGDIRGACTHEAFLRSIGFLEQLFGASRTAVACDLHPDYLSTRYAAACGLPRLAVQHHLAHILACLLEHSHPAHGVLGVAWDGAGFGGDGSIWGGEFLLLDRNQARRVARLRPFRLPGGDAAARDGRRSALALLRGAGHPAYGEFAARSRLEAELPVLTRMLDAGVRSPWCSSMGRLFDGAAALLGLGSLNRFEGQLAMALEAAASPATAGGRRLALPLSPGSNDVPWELDWEPLVAHLAGAKAADAPGWAHAFHAALAEAVVAVAKAAGVGTVALSGGCFQNALLLELTVRALQQAGLRPLVHRELPANDGNISAGQAYAAALGLSSVVGGVPPPARASLPCVSPSPAS